MSSPSDTPELTFTIDDSIRAFAPDEYGWISSPQSNAIRILESEYGDLSSPTFDAVDALFYAVRYGLCPAVSLLLAPPYSVDPDSTVPLTATGVGARDRGKTSLHIAAGFGNVATAKILMDAGADPIGIVEPTLNHTPFDLALCKGRKEIAQFMMESILSGHRDLRTPVAQTSLRHAVLYAAGSRDVEVVNMLLGKKAPIDTRTVDRGQSALLVAAELGVVDVVRSLAEWEGGDEECEGEQEGNTEVHWLTYDGETPLSVAMMRNQRGVVRELVRLGVDVDHPWRDDDRAALSLVAEEDVDGMVGLLLDLGADPDWANNWGWTALHYAVSAGREGNVRELLRRGADVKAMTYDTEETAVDIAAKQGSADVLGRLSTWPEEIPGRELMFLAAAERGCVREAQMWVDKGVHVNVADQSGYTALILSAKGGHFEFVEWVLSISGHDVNGRDERGHTALWWASWYGHVETIAALLEEGADSELVDETGTAAVTVAGQKGWSAAVEVLLARDGQSKSTSRNAGIETETDKSHELVNTEPEDVWRCQGRDVPDFVNDWFDQEDALFVVATHGRVTSASVLILMGTDVDCRNSNGQTPLMIAARKGDVSMVKLLLHEHGAQLELLNELGQTALYEAAAWGQNEAVEAMLEGGADIAKKDHLGRTPLMVAAKFGHENVASVLLAAGADPHAVDDEGKAALMHAASSGSHSAVLLLLARGGELEQKDKNGTTPLLAAAQRGQFAVAEMLLARGAFVSHTNNEGKTALSLAAQFGHEEVSGLLIQHGANTNHGCHTGETPLVLASRGRHAMMVRIFVEHGAQTNVPDQDGVTALSAAQEGGFDEIVELLSRSSHYRATSQLTTFGTRSTYRYSALRNNTSTRLIELHPGTETDILSFDLFEVDLKKNPYYETLSYEWGDKRGSIPALCNGGYLLITPNLKRAMTRIRSTEMRRTLWIDAVCINQADITERSQQVSLMQKIYHEASSTLIWLGQATKATESGVKNADLLGEQYDVISQVPGWLPDCRHILQVDDKTYRIILENWHTILSDAHAVEGLHDLFGRSYFTRAWVVQELLLTRSGTVMCGSHSINWKTVKLALRALDFVSRYALIESFATYNPRFRDILELTEKYPWLRNLTADLDLFTTGLILAVPMIKGLGRLGTFDASDPRDKIYASSGFTNMTDSDRKEFPADYNLSVQEVYTNAIRHALSRDSPKISNLGKYMRPYARNIPNLPSWIPDWSRPIWLDKPFTRYTVSHLIAGDVSTSDTNSLFVNGYITDRVTQVIQITRDMRVIDVVKQATLMLAITHSKSPLDTYPHMTNIPTSEEKEKPANYLATIWDVMTPEDKELYLDERRRDIMSFFLSEFAQDDNSTVELVQAREEAIEMMSMGMGKEELDIEDYDWMEREVRRGDLVITERGGLGITNAVNVAEEGMVVAIVGSADELYLLRGCGGGDSEEGVIESEEVAKWYEFVDIVDMKHMRRHFTNLDEVKEGASDRIERLEIR